MGPHTIVGVCSPQVVVLKEPNSRNWFIVNVEQIKPFNSATPTTPNSRRFSRKVQLTPQQA